MRGVLLWPDQVISFDWMDMEEGRWPRDALHPKMGVLWRTLVLTWAVASYNKTAKSKVW